MYEVSSKKQIYAILNSCFMYILITQINRKPQIYARLHIVGTVHVIAAYDLIYLV